MTNFKSWTPIELPADPTEDLQAATKRYVDANSGGGSSLILVDAGTMTVDDSDPDHVTVTVETVWGIDGSGDPYYDDAGAAPGEEAALYWNPATGVYTLVSFDF